MAATKSPGISVQPQPIRKFQVSALKVVPHVDMAAAVQIWAELHTAIQTIYQQNASALSFEALHRRAYTLTLHKHGELLYEGVTKTIKDHLAEEVLHLRAVPDSLLLRRLQEAWEAHSRDILKIRDILMYMVCHTGGGRFVMVMSVHPTAGTKFRCHESKAGHAGSRHDAISRSHCTRRVHSAADPQAAP